MGNSLFKKNTILTFLHFKQFSHKIMLIRPYLNQNFYELKQKCLSERILFKDESFLPDDRSLKRTRNLSNDEKICWKRPHEIIENPAFLTTTATNPTYLNQGNLGNCWVISGIVCLLKFPEYANKILYIEEEQSFEKKTYAGIFHFRFWRFGEWWDVTVDDFLPVNEFNKLIFCNNAMDPEEMIGPLIEKAFAKIFTCYEFLIAGEPIDAIIDLCGGVSERFSLSKIKDGTCKNLDTNKLWNLIFISSNFKKSCITTSIKTKEQHIIDHLNELDLVIGHSYCILETVEIYYNDESKTYDTLRTNPDERAQLNSIRLIK